MHFYHYPFDKKPNMERTNITEARLQAEMAH
jgi:hypothetical protein